MKVLHVFFFLKTGGVETNLARLLPRLQQTPEMDHELVLAVSGGAFLRKLEKHLPVTVLDGKDMFRGIFSRACKADLVHVYSINDMRLLTDAVAWSSARVIENLHCPVASTAPHLSDLLVTVAYPIEALQPVCGSGVFTVPSGLSPGPPPPADKFDGKGPVRIVEVARPNKSLRFKLADFYPLLSQGGRVHLDIVGSEGIDRPGLHFHGLQNDVRPFLRRAHFLFTAPAFDAFPTAVLEAMRDGTVPVARTVGGIPDQVVAGRTGILFDQDDDFYAVAHRLKAVVEEALRNPERYRRMVLAGHKRLKRRFSIDTAAGMWQALYRHTPRNPRPTWGSKWSRRFGEFYDRFGLQRLSPAEGLFMAKSLSDRNERALALLRTAQLARTQSPRAAKQILESIEEVPLDPYDFHWTMCDAALALQDEKTAESAAEQCMAAAPTRIEPYLALAQLQLERGESGKAVDVLEASGGGSDVHPAVSRILSRIRDSKAFGAKRAARGAA